MKRNSYLRGTAACKIFIIYLFIMISAVFFKIDSSSLAAAESPPAGVAGLLEEEATSSDYLRIYKIRIGVMPGINLPMGDLGKALVMGFGADIFADGLLPYSPMENLSLRAGINIGFYSFATKNDISASLTMIPFLINCRAVYSTPSGFNPYAGLGLGLTANMASGDVAKSSYDGTLAINFGTEYQHQAIPQVDFFLDMRYMMAFETVTGQFLSVLAGAAYKFDSSKSVTTAAALPATVKEKPPMKKPVQTIIKQDYKKSEIEKFPPQEEFKFHQ